MAKDKIQNPNPGNEPSSSSTPSATNAPKQNGPNYMDPRHNQRYAKGAKYARRRRNKKIALLIAGIGTVGVTALSIIAFLGRVSGNFTIRVDPRQSDGQIALSLLPLASEEKSILKANGLNSAVPTAADDVYNYCSEFFDGDVERDVNGDPIKNDEGHFTPTGDHLTGENSLHGKMTSNGEDVVVDRAIVYTFYLKNKAFKEISYNMDMALTYYHEPTNKATQPSDYLRVMVFENEVTDVNSPAFTTHDFTVYGAANTSSWNTKAGYESDPSYDDRRECISQFYNPQLNPTKYKYRDPSLESVPALRGYCEPFITSDRELFSKKFIPLPTSGIMRYTVVCWLEGYDPDCYGTPPQGVELAFGINFTVN